MIYIFDDSITVQRKAMLSFLHDESYSRICKVIEQPTMEMLRNTSASITTDKIPLVCIHRSLKIFNENGEALGNAETIRGNFVSGIRGGNIPCIVFGRDMNNNKQSLFIDKDLFYRNLKLFLDSYSRGTLEPNILYDGALYHIADRKRQLNTILTIVNSEDKESWNKNSILEKAIESYLPNDNFFDIIEQWKQMSKKEIMYYINEKL